MLKNLSVSIAAVSLAGCAGLDIASLSIEAANDAHSQGKEVKGYIVYHPMVVVEVAEKELCVVKNEKGQCTNVKNVCGVGEPKVLPDYSKPYLLTPKSGLGKAGVDVKIEEGWRLGGIKGESDNTALLGVLAAAGGIGTSGQGPVSDAAISGCSDSGLYQLKPLKGGIQLIPILKY